MGNGVADEHSAAKALTTPVSAKLPPLAIIH
jgi:hypothetical protein